MICILLDHLLKALLFLFYRKYLVTVQTQADRVRLFDLDCYWFNPHIQIKNSCMVRKIHFLQFGGRNLVLCVLAARGTSVAHKTSHSARILCCVYILFVYFGDGISIARFSNEIVL